MLDTGSPVSLLSLHAAAAAGISPASAGVVKDVTAPVFGAQLIDTWIAPVDILKVGDEEIKHTHLRIGTLLIPDIDMLLGIDFFLSHRIYVPSHDRRLFFTYNGGHVFDVNVRPASAGSDTQAATTAGAGLPEVAITNSAVDGTWIGRGYDSLRVRLRVKRDASGHEECSFDSLDQGLTAMGQPCSDVVYTGTELSFSIPTDVPSLGARCALTLSADRQSLFGSCWEPHHGLLPAKLTRQIRQFQPY
jgi:hypothetical protein